MTGAVITADLAIAQAKSSVAGIRIILVGIRIFPNIFQCRHNFKGRTRRIQSLCSPVDQYGTGIVIYQILPYFSDGIGIKIRMGYHGKNLPGRHFGYNNGTAIDIQLIICHLLDFNIQCSVNIIPGILFSGSIVFHLVTQGSICIDQIIIGQRFYTHSALCGIANNVRKQIFVRVVTALFFLIIQDCLRKYLSISGIDGSPIISRQQYLLS